MHEELEKEMNVKEEGLLIIKENIKEIQENKFALENYWNDSEPMNEVLREQIVLIESERSHLKDEPFFIIQGKIEKCTNTNTQSKLSNFSTILDKILSNQRYLEDKTRIYTKEIDDMSDKGGFVFKQ